MRFCWNGAYYGWRAVYIKTIWEARTCVDRFFSPNVPFISVWHVFLPVTARATKLHIAQCSGFSHIAKTLLGRCVATICFYCHLLHIKFVLIARHKYNQNNNQITARSYRIGIQLSALLALAMSTFIKSFQIFIIVFRHMETNVTYTNKLSRSWKRTNCVHHKFIGKHFPI